MTIGIVDYGAGNIFSVRNALARIGASASRVSTPEDVLAADRLVLPGVGASGAAMEKLRERGLDSALEEAVRRRARPLFCICVGMQMLAVRLHEFGLHRGLGWLEGDVVPLADIVGGGVRTPAMGWAPVFPCGADDPILGALGNRLEFYFCHSFALSTAATRSVVAEARNGGSYAAAIRFDTVYGTQFHPEKSQINGLRLLEAFLAWAP
jgi:glutamine amidotransferase